VSHTDPEILALRALGETAGTAHDAEHAESCAHCQAELARLTEVVRLARDADPGETLLAPPPGVWDRIAAATGVSVAPIAAAPNGPAPNGPAPNGPVLKGPVLNGSALNGSGTPAEAMATPEAVATPESVAAPAEAPTSLEDRRRSRPSHRRAGRPRRRLVGALAAVAAGLVIGIGGTIGVAQVVKSPPAHVVARIELNPLPQFPQWQGTTGTAVMRATASRQQQLVVALRAPARPGFYEVWLLARDGVSMISLGDLSADHTGTFTMPPGVDLRDYSRIDISLQPFNGSTQHSKTSVVRGSLPATALGGAATARA
jgi:Anti-sigma-K factor rskA